VRAAFAGSGAVEVELAGSGFGARQLILLEIASDLSQQMAAKCAIVSTEINEATGSRWS